jgi:hypothetical protein
MPGGDSNVGDRSSQSNQPEKIQCCDHIRRSFCGREDRIFSVENIERSFNAEKVEIEGRLNSISEDVARSFRIRIDSLTTEFCQTYEQVKRVSAPRDYKIGRQENMKLINADIQKLNEIVKEDLPILQLFREAREKHELVLNDIRQDDQIRLRNLAHKRVESVMEEYSLALHSRDLQGQERSRAKKQIEKISRWLEERALWLQERPGVFEDINEIEQEMNKLRGYIEENLDFGPEELKKVFRDNVKAFQNSHDQIIHSYGSLEDDGWKKIWDQGEQSMKQNLGELLEVKKDLDSLRQYEEEIQEMKKCKDSFCSLIEAKQEHDEAMKNYIPQEYQLLVRKLAKEKVMPILADHMEILQNKQKRSDILQHSEEITLWLRECCERYKEPIQQLIRNIKRVLDEKAINREYLQYALDEGIITEEYLKDIIDDNIIPKGSVRNVLQEPFFQKVEQFDKECKGEIKQRTRTPEQWMQEFKDSYAEIARVSNCYKRYGERELAIHLMNKPSKNTITDEWEKCCISHDALVTCMRDEFKGIYPDIHEKMKIYQKNIEAYKEGIVQLEENLKKVPPILAKDGRPEAYLAEVRKLSTAKETQLKGIKTLIKGLKAEHEKFKEYLRDRGWLEEDTSTKAPVSYPPQLQADIASTSGS